jgi:hypothetical protein
VYILSNPDTAPLFVHHSLWWYFEGRQKRWEKEVEDVSSDWMTFRKREATGN